MAAGGTAPLVPHPGTGCSNGGTPGAGTRRPAASWAAAVPAGRRGRRACRPLTPPVSAGRRRRLCLRAAVAACACGPPTPPACACWPCRCGSWPARSRWRRARCRRSWRPMRRRPTSRTRWRMQGCTWWATLSRWEQRTVFPALHGNTQDSWWLPALPPARRSPRTRGRGGGGVPTRRWLRGLPACPPHARCCRRLLQAQGGPDFTATSGGAVLAPAAAMMEGGVGTAGGFGSMGGLGSESRRALPVRQSSQHVGPLVLASVQLPCPPGVAPARAWLTSATAGRALRCRRARHWQHDHRSHGRWPGRHGQQHGRPGSSRHGVGRNGRARRWAGRRHGTHGRRR